MITFNPITLEDKENYQRYLLNKNDQGCEYSFANLYLWGRQSATILHDHLVLFSQYNRRSVYPYPVGTGDKRTVLDAIIADAKERGIPCRITSLNSDDMQTLEALCPGRFRFHCDRGSHDYVYAIDDLADLPGKKYQKKRNHCNRFKTDNPNYRVEPLNENNLSLVKEMIGNWYWDKLAENPEADYLMEQTALYKALRHFHELEMDGLVLFIENEVVAITLGSRLTPNTIDVQFEKAKGEINGAYAVINQEFARYLRAKYPEVKFLNREEDMGIEGLRIAKQRYFPHHMIEKCWAHLMEDDYEY
ncbi:MAG: DUF2156 domain-containing protein [Roseburia sp.]|nr:DUF2156 domain-containing protein [Roseburia sp.]